MFLNFSEYKGFKIKDCNLDIIQLINFGNQFSWQDVGYVKKRIFGASYGEARAVLSKSNLEDEMKFNLTSGMICSRKIVSKPNF